MTHDQNLSYDLLLLCTGKGERRVIAHLESFVPPVAVLTADVAVVIPLLHQSIRIHALFSSFVNRVFGPAALSPERDS